MRINLGGPLGGSAGSAIPFTTIAVLFRYNETLIRSARNAVANARATPQINNEHRIVYPARPTRLFEN